MNELLQTHWPQIAAAVAAGINEAGDPISTNIYFDIKC